ncbi:hypothetical protein [Paenibacillus sp. FSL K6-2859]|uniref:hypothetical protein n=1 Tax=Paenibacillus sp. FSL K6-2859 TaxID=2921482 RepID=UPI0030FD0D04
MLKCYLVQDRSGEHQQLVFAEKRSIAIVESEAYEWEGYYTEIRATREPAFDVYAEQGYVPKEVLVANGWWFECYGWNERGYRCCVRLCEEDKPLIIGDKVYCNEAHTRKMKEVA